jgi:hypothetical protein
MSYNFIPTLKYLWLTTKHKYFVFKAGLKTKTPIWRLVIHDWSKFTIFEAPHYGRQFFGSANDPLGFSYAWLHHQLNNAHHWEYWVMVSGHNRGGYPDGSPLPMPEKYVREMVADWMGASRAYEGKWPENLEKWEWWRNNFEKIKLHPQTRNLCRKVVEEALKR